MTINNFKLTKEKQRWAKNRTGVTLNGGLLNYNIGYQKKYESELNGVFTAMFKKVEKELLKLFKSPTAKKYYAQDASLASQVKIIMNKLKKVYLPFFDKKAPLLAKSVTKKAIKLSTINLKSSLKELSGGATLKTDFLTENLNEVVKAAVNENVSLIKSISAQYLKDVEEAAYRSITTEGGYPQLLKALQNRKEISLRHAKNVSLDQTRKIYNYINRERMQAVGVESFEWIHSGGGQRPRKDHIEMSGKIYSFNNLPIIEKKTGERGIPGQAINCKCTMRPVINLE